MLLWQWQQQQQDSFMAVVAMASVARGIVCTRPLVFIKLLDLVSKATCLSALVNSKVAVHMPPRVIIAVIF